MENLTFERMEERPMYTVVGNSFGSYAKLDRKSHEHKAIISAETGRIISVVGKGYKLVQNADIIPQYENAIEKSNLNTDKMYRKVQTSHGGKRTIVSYTFPAHRVAIRENDFLDLKIAVLNSYDGSWRFGSIVGAYRVLCTNGLTIGESFSSFYGKHTQKLDVDLAIKQLEGALRTYTVNTEAWRDYPEVKLDSIDVTSVFDKLAGDNKKHKDFLMSTFRNYINELGYNLWALFNTLTHWSTHSTVRKLENSGAIIVQREAKVRKVLPLLDAMWKAHIKEGGDYYKAHAVLRNARLDYV